MLCRTSANRNATTFGFAICRSSLAMIAGLMVSLVIHGESVRAAMTFTEDFSGMALPSNMNDPNGPTTDFSAANATFSSVRHYLRTNDTDYGVSADFVAEGTVTLSATDTGPNAIAFFGLGGGTNTGAFATPAIPNVFGEISPVGFFDGYFRGNDNGVEVGGLQGTGNGGWGAGTVHRIRLTWTSATQQALLELDQGYTGVFSADFTQVLDGSDNGLDSSNSRLFFGGNSLVSWDDISVAVVPEPGSLALFSTFGVAMLLGLTLRRRRGIRR